MQLGTNKIINFSMIMILVCLAPYVMGEGLSVHLVPVDAEKMVIVPAEQIDGWNSNVNLVDTLWTSCSGSPGGIGFDTSGEYLKYITLNIYEQMQGRRTTCYIRAKFRLTPAVRNELDYLALGIRYDDGFIAYLNGEQVASANAPLNPGHRASASQPHEARSMLLFDISHHVDKLIDGENLFALHGMNVDGSSPDFLIQFELFARKNYRNNFVSDLPIIIINTDGKQPVNVNTIHLGSMNIIHNGAGSLHTLNDRINDYSGQLTIAQNTTAYDYPKNHFFITLKDGQAQTQSASLLGLPAGDEWILYAPYNDKTLVRTVLMGEIAHYMGRGSAPQMCHLFLNDDYMGMYVLLEKSNRHVNRINIAEPGQEGDALTGGYILSLRKDRLAAGFDSVFEPFRNAPFPVRYLYTYPTPDNSTTPQQAYIQSYMRTFETDVVNSIDIASAVDYFLINEVAKNVDAYRDHTILYKNQGSENPRLFVKSILDFNNSCGNTRLYAGDRIEGWQLSFLSQPNNVSRDSMFVPLWWQQLFNHVEFTRALYKRWHTLKLSNAFVSQKIDSLYALLQNDAVLNFERWLVINKPIEPYAHVGETFDDDYDFMHLWMMDRLDWISTAMETFASSVTATAKQVSSFALEQNSPNPFNPKTTISYNLPASCHVILRIYNSRGALVNELVNEHQSAGFYTLQWDAHDRPSGIYFYKMTAGDFSQSQRMLLIR